MYATLPPAIVAAFALHERRRPGRHVDVPLVTTTKVGFGAAAAALAVLGLWLYLDPDGALAQRWPWTLPPISAAIVGTWLLTFAAALAWGLLERDWRRAELAVLPGVAVAAADLFSAVRLSETLTGSGAAVALYAAALVALVTVLAGAWLTQRRARPRRERRPGGRRSP